MVERKAKEKSPLIFVAAQKGTETMKTMYPFQDTPIIYIDVSFILHLSMHPEGSNFVWTFVLPETFKQIKKRCMQNYVQS